MLYPSIDELMNKVDSKYILVTLASKRARNLQDKSPLLLSKPKSHKYVGKALEEIFADELGFEREFVIQTSKLEK
ncbi:MAG: DNA-directed polymerase subunit omega [Bacillales bacterium]|jgi:DNA-directed RNA polymerase subunit omega|nr:DNA-directed polymerase subunit omega [Bacillales bacterium]